MSKEKSLINNLKNKAIEFQNDPNYPEEVEEYNKMKVSLADSLYSQNSHFIYELIQNADDCDDNQ